MKTNIYLIKTTFLSIALPMVLLNGIAQANTNCSGDSCIASFSSSTNTRTVSTFKKYLQPVESVSREEQRREEQNSEEDKSYMVSNTIKEQQPKEESESYLASNIVQIGAFSHYYTAKICARRYKLMGDHFRTKISKIKREGRDIYKVQIIGFENPQEAQQFIAMYSTTGAFLVRK